MVANLPFTPDTPGVISLSTSVLEAKMVSAELIRGLACSCYG